jgi:hypothetical protein
MERSALVVASRDANALTLAQSATWKKERIGLLVERHRRANDVGRVVVCFVFGKWLSKA